MKKITFDDLLEIIKSTNDPLQQIAQTSYEVDGYYVCLVGNVIQWRTPVQTNFTLGLTFDEFLKQAESLA